MISIGTISNFVKRFKSQEELVMWLKSTRKDRLHALYMEDTNYDGLGYENITKSQLKEMFLDKYKETDYTIKENNI